MGKLATGFVWVAMVCVTGCATLSKEECQVADWQAIGFEDGAKGRAADYVANHREACAKHGIQLEKAAYDEGYEAGIGRYCVYGRGYENAVAGARRQQVCPQGSEYVAGYRSGLESFCTYEAGHEFGLQGGDYRHTCPAESQTDFLAGYQLGREVHQLLEEIDSLEHKIDQLVRERQALQDQQEELRNNAVHGEYLDAEGRADIFMTIDELQQERDELELQTREYEVRVTEKQAQLEDLLHH